MEEQAVLNEGGPWGGSPGGPGDGDGKGGGGLGPRNPWRQPPGKRGGGRAGMNPPALDALLRRGRERFGGRLPSGGGQTLWLWAVALLVVLWLVGTSFHRVEPQERGVVTRLGKYAGTLRPGISFTYPAPIDTVTPVNVDGIRTVDIDSSGDKGNLVLTGDQNIIDLAYSVRWSIRDPELYIFELADPDDTIREVAESAMREEIARVSLNDAIGSQRGQIEGRVATRMQALLDSYRAGVVIQGVAIRQADPPAQVLDAFKEVSAAQQEAQSYLNGARAYAEQLTAKAQGEATAFDKVYEQYRLAPEVTRRRMYYETMEDVLSKVDKTVVQAPGVMPYLPLDRARKAAPAQAPAEEPGR
ncbi:FtsH protease activity modulator HflK [Sphingomonas sp. XMGL2]|uniref:Protein HflK n=2 Tax=Sphingomonas quercus TaxID=2842451 RepID=A0ABS6BGJ9_9SPHN|nr:FtsH protease activity modulator HflK [Sphingomonas quercus]